MSYGNTSTAHVRLLELPSGGSATVEVDGSLACEIATAAPIRSVSRIPADVYSRRHHVAVTVEPAMPSARIVHVTRVDAWLVLEPLTGAAFPTRAMARDEYLYECARRFSRERTAAAAACRVDEDAPSAGRDYHARFPRMSSDIPHPPPPPSSSSSGPRYRQKAKKDRPASWCWRPDFDDENGGPEPWWPAQERYSHAMFVALRRMPDPATRSPHESTWAVMDRHCAHDTYTRDEFETMLGHYWKGREAKLMGSGWHFFRPYRPSARITYED